MRPWRNIISYLAPLFAVFILMFHLRPLPALAQPEGGRSMIAFVKSDDTTYDMTLSLVDPATGEITDLMNQGHFFFPVISPDGKLVDELGDIHTALAKARSLASLPDHAPLVVVGGKGKSLLPQLADRANPAASLAYMHDSLNAIANGSPQLLLDVTLKL